MQHKYVMKEISDFREVFGKDEWRSVMIIPGGQCVMTSGMMLMPLLLADN